MITMKCPNCGRTYNEADECANLLIPCMNCRYPLKKIEDVKNVKNPKLNEHKVVGTVADPTKPQPKCIYCQSTNIKKISGTERAVSILGLGIFSKKINKSCKCLDCKCTW